MSKEVGNPDVEIKVIVDLAGGDVEGSKSPGAATLWVRAGSEVPVSAEAILKDLIETRLVKKLNVQALNPVEAGLEPSVDDKPSSVQASIPHPQDDWHPRSSGTANSGSSGTDWTDPDFD